MAELQVMCVNKFPRENPHEGITHLGGFSAKPLFPDGYTWNFSRKEVIHRIQNGRDTSFTHVNGKRAEVEAVPGPNGTYLRTHADGTYNDNLLALPECLS